MATLLGALSKEYHTPVDVNARSGSHLSITFQDPGQEAKLDSAGRVDFARHVATFVRLPYPRRASLADISVSVDTTSDAGPLSMTRRDAPYTFGMDELR